MLRIGHGYDVHQFAEGRPLILGGVTIDYPQGLLGHSDADVVVHALIDAMLGAMRAKSIGDLFPDTDPQYKNANSLELLARVGRLMREKGFALVDCDCTIVAQAPKLKEHIADMRCNMACALQLSSEQVGVKATTTEGLGFEGKKEGIAACAVVLLDLPDERAHE